MQRIVMHDFRGHWSGALRDAYKGEDPSPERPRQRLWVGLLLNGAARALTVAAPMVTLPMVTSSLGKTNYGAYAVITAIATFLPWADLGVGLGLVTAVSQASGRRDPDAIRTIVSTGLVMLLWVGGALLALALLLGVVLDWRSVLGLADSRVTGDIRLAVLFVFLSFAVGIPANVGMKVMLALQMNRALAFWQAAAVPAVVVAVGLAYLTSATLPWFVLATTGAPNAVAVAAALWLFRRARPDLSPSLSLSKRRDVPALLALGVVFSVNSAAAAVGDSTNSVVISHLVGVDEVAVYNISARLSAVPLLVFTGLLLPLWPVFGAGLAAEEYAATRARLRKAVRLSVSAGLVAAAVFVVAGPSAIKLWVGVAYVPSGDLLIALAAGSVVQFAAYPYALMLSGAGAKRFLLVTAILVAATHLPLSIALARAVGVAGPTWAGCVSTLLFVLLPSAYYADRYVRRRASVAREPAQTRTSMTITDPVPDTANPS